MTKQRIMDNVWDRIVDEGNISNCVFELRKVLGDREESPTYIETVPARGYRFIASVQSMYNGEGSWSKRLQTRGDPLRYVAPGYFLEEEERHLTAAGYTNGEARQLTDQKLALEQEILMGAVLRALLEHPLSQNAFAKSRSKHVVDVGTGTGELAIRIAPVLSKLHGRFTGVDIAADVLNHAQQRLTAMRMTSSEIKVTIGNATELPKLFRKESVWLAVWGKFGVHLGKGEEWNKGLGQIREILEPNGYFLLYEPLQDLNHQYNEMRGGSPQLGETTYVRTVQDYIEALHPMRLMLMKSCKFCYETYAIGLWQRV